ncbi:MAG: hypothetical protein K8F30_03010, partial [Taibaiella sp.]|nr:hypothetical protein [Taibaiella sp.]
HGKILYLRGNYEDAKKVLEQNISKQQHPFNKSLRLTYLGYTYFELGEIETALEQFCSAIEIAKTELMPIAIEAVLGVALIIGQRQEVEEATTLASFAMERPMSEAETRERARKFVEAIPEQSLGSNARLAAQAKGANATFEQVVSRATAKCSIL